jgi:Spy/CpxP family protein refolding chaperone
MEHRTMIEFVYVVSLSRRLLLMGSIVVASCCALWAQQETTPGPPPGEMRQRGPGIDRELKHLTNLLTLTEAQQAQVKAILAAQKQQMDTLHKPADEGGNGGEAVRPSRVQMDTIHDATDAKIAALLTDEQKPKFAAWQQQRKQMMEGRRGPRSEGAPAPQ